MNRYHTDTDFVVNFIEYTTVKKMKIGGKYFFKDMSECI